MKKVKATNPQLIEVIQSLKRQSKENKAKIWKTVAEQMAKPKRKRVAVNVCRLNRFTQKNDIVVVPGKVLGAGEIDHRITVAAFAFSEKAREKIIKAKGKCLFLPDLAAKNPKGSNLKIIG